MNRRSSRAPRALAALLLAAFAAAGLLGLSGCRSETHAGSEVWFCPMHPDYVSDRPGSCPICHMDLVKREPEAKPTLWVCPMHPEVVRHEPGQCPICGMDLIGKSDGAAAAPAGERRVLFYRNPMDPSITSPVPAKDEMGMDYVPVFADEAAGAAPGGLAAVDLSNEGRRLAGVVVAEARAGSLARIVRTVGSVVADERRARRI